MCRNIRLLFNFDPPATDEEIRASAVQFVRKVSGFARPSQANTEAFERAVDEVAATARKLIVSLKSAAPPHDRAAEAVKARERSASGSDEPHRPSSTLFASVGVDRRRSPCGERLGRAGGNLDHERMAARHRRSSGLRRNRRPGRPTARR